MKKFLLFVIVCSLFLSGCVIMAPAGPETVNINGATYITGFYGKLFPHSLKQIQNPFTLDNITFRQLKHDQFDLYHANVGPYTEGSIYCAESDYEDALAFYSDPGNYTYHCQFSESRTMELTDIDTDMFDALLQFAEESSYNPFSATHNSRIKTVNLPMPESLKEAELCFYKKSCDSLFISTRGTHYYIYEDHLYLVFYFDFGHGKHEKLVAAKLPDDLSSYFLELIKPQMEK